MKYIYHITNNKTWSQAQEKNSYDFCTLKTSGFIHASTEDQYLDVANAKFLNQKDLILLKIDTNTVEPKIVYENLEGGSEQYPHIYGALNPKSVVAIFNLELTENQASFKKIFLK